MRVKLKKAVQNGNWSDPNTWSLGVKPQPGDHVAANGFTVTIDEDVDVESITIDQIYIYSANAVPDMISNDTPLYLDNNDENGEVIYYSRGEVRSDAYSSFDGNFNNNNNGSTLRMFSTGDAWIGFKFNNPVVLDSYFIEDSYTNYTGRTLDEFEFQASNDGVNWTTLHSDSKGGNRVYYSPTSVGNSTAYTHYRVYAVNMYISNNDRWYIEEIGFFYKGYDYECVKGGTFILNDNVTLTCSSTVCGIYGNTSSSQVLLYSGSQSATINALVGKVLDVNYRQTIYHDGTGTLNIIGGFVDNFVTRSTDFDVYQPYIERYGGWLYGNGTGTTNVVGYVDYTNYRDTHRGFVFRNGHTFNMTGDFINSYTGGGGFIQNIFNCYDSFINIVGDIPLLARDNSSSISTTMFIIGRTSGQITGNVTCKKSSNPIAASSMYIDNRNAEILTIIGTVETETQYYAIKIYGENDLNITYTNGLIFSGPFVCSPYGHIPFQLRKLQLIDGFNTYFQFRKSNIMFNEYPNTEPDPINLVSPDTIIDSPAQEDVREGTSYANGNYTGTLAVPSPDRVSAGIPTDDTVGTAVLTPEDVWNAQTSAMNTNGSIGKRLKNASTVDSTGDQLSSLL